MRKTVFSLGALAALALAAAATATSALATTATATFDVSINLTSGCRIHSTPTGTTFTYTAFQASAATFSSTFNVQCTNTLPITSVRLDDGSGNQATGLSQSYTDTATSLAYSLTLSGVPSTGTGADQSVTVAGSMAADQAGKCATATCSNSASTNKTRTVYINY